MKIIAITSQRIEVGPKQSVEEWIEESFQKNNEKIAESDIVVITSKAISYFEDRVMDLSWIKVDEETKKIAMRMNADEKVIQIALFEADEVITETPWVLLTRKNGIYIANAGVDTSNVPEGFVSLWPKHPFESAKKIREKLINKYSLKKLAVIIIDSACTPGRNGTSAIAIGYAGISGYQSLKGTADLYNNTLQYSALNIVDSLATSANLLMGEGSEGKPLAVIRDYDWKQQETKNDEMLIAPSDEMFPLQ